MSEPVFFHRGRGLTIADIVKLTGAEVANTAPGDRRIWDVAAPERAGPGDVTFIDGTDAERRLRFSQAGACFVSTRALIALSAETIGLAVDDPYRAFVRTAAALYPDASRPSSLFEVQGVAGSAFVHSSARVEAGVTIDPAAIIAPNAEIGSGTVIGPMVVVGPQVRIGRDCSIEIGASVTNALVGDGVVLGPGCRIGPAQDGQAPRARDVAPALGRAILQDKVVVGSNSAVERGSNQDTIIGEGTQIDPLVRIPADSVVGRYCRIRSGEAEQARDPVRLDVSCVDDVQFFASQLSRSGRDYSRG
jgi:UDP-3-O-[3-hydroxymyristoyl] glucosamine N-acyltransferase